MGLLNEIMFCDSLMCF